MGSRSALYPSGKGQVCKTFIHRFDSDRRLYLLIDMIFQNKPRWWNLVDTRDLKSLGLLVRAGSIPALGNFERYFQFLIRSTKSLTPKPVADLGL